MSVWMACLIGAGYIYLLVAFGWVGLLVLAAHIGAMLVTIRRK